MSTSPRTRSWIRHTAALTTAAAAAAGLSACVANESSDENNASGGNGEPIAVTIKDDSCEVPTSSVPQGRVTFSLTNAGTVRNEFEVLAEDKLRIVGERENLGPGTNTDYTIVLEPGTYYTACKANMVGDLVDVREFTVTDEGELPEVDASKQELIDQAVTNYTAYVRDQTGQLLEGTKAFAELYASGKDDEARAAYAKTRTPYERIEPTAESFGDIDPALDERESDFQEDDAKGQRQWTGWHVIEKDLWAPENGKTKSPEERKKVADQLIKDTQALYDLVYSDDFNITIDEISNGAIALLEEVAISKITGEEEIFSHTDLWDFQANLEGAKVAYGTVETLAKDNDADLADTISARIEELEGELDKFREGDGFRDYDTLSEQDVRELSDRVDALRKVLAQLTEAVLS